jgi:membrane-associated PAP2 superfamily phosphatase
MSRMGAFENLFGFAKPRSTTVWTADGADHVWLQYQVWGLLLVAIVLLLVFENSRLDLTLSALAFDPVLGHFPMQRHWFFSEVMHHGLKTVSYILAIPALAIAVLGHLGHINWLPPRNARLAGLGMLLIPLATVLLKLVTNRHCPWDIVDFGGYAPYVSLFASTPETIVRGNCFPAGHASGGFVWMIWGIALRATRPRLANWMLLAGIAFGLLMGWSRLMQGAHFLSHVLWSGWLAWALAIALAAVLRVPVLPKHSD